MTSKTNKQYLFHPLEVSFCGFSGSGKSTLISKLIERLSDKLDIGYVKHDTHCFEMDREGKDTWKAAQAGSKVVAISSPDKSALLQYGTQNNILDTRAFVDMDVVIIEGYKESLTRKILLLGEGAQQEKMLKKYNDGDFKNVIAMIGSMENATTTTLPYFHRDNVVGIEEFLLSLWNDLMLARPLYGLILGGGRSVRMGTDKGSLKYFGKSQIKYLWELANNFTTKTFISCREEQKSESHIQSLPTIEDRFLGFGPSGGILSAMNLYPEAAWLVLACDLPYLNAATLEYLIEQRNAYKVATCFNNPEKNWPEPLCTIYEPKAVKKLGMYLIEGKPCPRKVLFNSNIKTLELTTKNALDNVNNLEQYQKAREDINNKRSLS